MPRQMSTKISADDLEFAVEHLVRLAYSPVRAGNVEEKHSIVVDREELLLIALETDRLIGLTAINDVGPEFNKRVDKCCHDLEIVIKKTLNKDGFSKMRLAIRQRRFNSPPSQIGLHYKCVI